MELGRYLLSGIFRQQVHEFLAVNIAAVEPQDTRQGTGGRLSLFCLGGTWVCRGWSRSTDGPCFSFLAAAVFRLALKVFAFLQAKHLGC